MNGGSCCAISTPEDTTNPFEHLLSEKIPKSDETIFYSLRLSLVCKACEQTDDIRIMVKCTHSPNKRPVWQRQSRAPLIGQLMDALKSPVENARENLGKVCDKYPQAFDRTFVNAFFGLNRMNEVDETLPLRSYGRSRITQSDLCRYFYTHERDFRYTCGGVFFRRYLLDSASVKNLTLTDRPMAYSHPIGTDPYRTKPASLTIKDLLRGTNSPTTTKHAKPQFDKHGEVFEYGTRYVNASNFSGNLYIAVDPDSDGASNLCIVTGYVVNLGVTRMANAAASVKSINTKLFVVLAIDFTNSKDHKCQEQAIIRHLKMIDSIPAFRNANKVCIPENMTGVFHTRLEAYVRKYADRNNKTIHVLRQGGGDKFGVRTDMCAKAKYRRRISANLINGTVLWDINFFSTTGANGHMIDTNSRIEEAKSNAESAKREFNRQLNSWVLKDGKLTGKLNGANDDSVISFGIFMLYSKRVEKSKPGDAYYVYNRESVV